ncbi:MAG: M23 family metallopeptidase [Tannerella sp.]|nr:M23 family metallopeptidase [Tannerella sp.]
MKTTLTLSLWMLTFIVASAQQLGNPLEFPMQLSGSFCELRGNHFHAGIDVRTQGTEGHPLHAVADGYISRISVSPWGYGNAIYITHPADSLITVYGHLQAFNPDLTAILRAKQYAAESFVADVNCNIPVKRGDLIGYSGNSGGSGGPHLHLEVRDLRNNMPLDPLEYYFIPDHRKPIVKGLMVCPVEGRGIANGSSSKQNIAFRNDKNDNPRILQPVEAWGEIGFSVRAVDRMDSTSFSYGIREISQVIDSVEVFLSLTDRFALDRADCINSCTDFEEWVMRGLFYIKTFTEPGNASHLVASRRSGLLTVNEERTYNVIITLKDIRGNRTLIPLRIIGRKQEITPPDTIGTSLLRWYQPNTFIAPGLRLETPENSLYSSLYMRYGSYYSSQYLSPVHVLHDRPVPLHAAARLSIVADSLFPFANFKQLGLVRISERGDWPLWTGGVYVDGRVEASITRLGTYAIANDTKPPEIRPLSPDRWRALRRIDVRIGDDLSGIATYRGEIDGNYALFEYDGKKSLLTYHFDDDRLYPGYHHLRLTVTDACGNTSVYENAFTW